MVGQPTLLGIPAGDWLAAASGFFGVILTIAAAVWIEDRRRRRLQLSDVDQLRSALLELRRSAEVLGPVARQAPAQQGYAPALAPFDAYIAATQAFAFVAGQIRVPNLALWKAVVAIRQLTADRVPVLEGTRIWITGQFNEPVPPFDYLATIRSVDEDLLPQIDAALAMLRQV